MMNNFLEQSIELQDQILSWRHQIHKSPEIGDHLPQTAAFVEKTLDELDIPHCRITESGIAAWIGKGEKTILIRADMDALPGNESSGLPFASTNGAVHSCGHDIHTASLLGAAALLKRIEPSLNGRVVLMFQPGEETMTGALDMVQNGLLDRFKPQLALAMHVNVGEVPNGEIWVKQGAFNASSDIFEVTVNGKSGHGAYPQNAVNPIYAAIQIINAFTEISRYEVAALEPNVLTVCAIESGNAGNVIPRSCKFRGSLRTFSVAVRNKIVERLAEVLADIAHAHRCSAELKILGSTPPLANPLEITRWAKSELVKLIGEDRVKTPALQSMGSEDYAQIAARVPSCYLSVGISRAEGCTVALHNENIVFDEKYVYLGAAAFAQLAYGYLNPQE